MTDQPPQSRSTPQQDGASPCAQNSRDVNGREQDTRQQEGSGDHEELKTPTEKQQAIQQDKSHPDITQLVSDYHQHVYRFCYRLAGKTADAEDLTQQTFLQAHAKIHQLRDTTKPGGWLLTIARNCFLKAHNRASNQTRAVGSEFDLDQYPGPNPPDSPVDGELLQHALDELPELFRVVVVMFYFEDCSYRDIAEKLDLPMGTVMSRLARAKQHLRNRLSEPRCEDRRQTDSDPGVQQADKEFAANDNQHGSPGPHRTSGHSVSDGRPVMKRG